MASTKAAPAVKRVVPTNTAHLAQLVAKLPAGQQYPSAAAMFAAATGGGATKRHGQAARQQLRSNGQGVGRGNRYSGVTPRGWLAAYKAVQAGTAQAAKAASAAKAKPAKAKVAKATSAK